MWTIPGAGLVDRQTVTLLGSGYRPGQGVMVIQCVADRPQDGRFCDVRTNVGLPTPAGEIDSPITVRQVLQTPEGSFDCRQFGCVLLVGGVGANTTPIPVPISFA